MGSVSPRNPTGRSYTPSGPGRTRGTPLYLPLCVSGRVLCLLVFPRLSLSPKGPRQDQRDLCLSAAVLERLDPVFHHVPTGRPYPSSDPGTIAETRV